MRAVDFTNAVGIFALNWKRKFNFAPLQHLKYWLNTDFCSHIFSVISQGHALNDQMDLSMSNKGFSGAFSGRTNEKLGDH